MDKLISYSNLGAKLCSVFRNQYHYLLCICSLLWTLDTFDLNGFDGIVLYTANSHTSSIKLCSNQSPPTVAPYFPPGCHQACVAHRLGAQSHVQIEVTNRLVAYIVCALSSITCSTYSAVRHTCCISVYIVRRACRPSHLNNRYVHRPFKWFKYLLSKL